VTTYAKTGRYTKLHFLVAFLANWQNEPKVGYHKESSGLGGDSETGPRPKLGADLASKRSLKRCPPRSKPPPVGRDYSGGHAGIFCPQHAANLKRAGMSGDSFILCPESRLTILPAASLICCACALLHLRRKSCLNRRPCGGFAKGHSRQRRPDAKQWQGTEQSSRCS
jgi:hypothetical protein